MDFKLSREHELLRKMYREFAQNEVKPLAAELDEEERFPAETIPKLAKLGLLGIPFPKKYGGAGGNNLAYAMAVEEIAKTCGTTSVIICAHTSLCCYPIYAYGTEEQKMKYLPDLLSGRKLGAFGLTEPGAGTDASGQQTTAFLIVHTGASLRFGPSRARFAHTERDGKIQREIQRDGRARRASGVIGRDKPGKAASERAEHGQQMILPQVPRDVPRRRGGQDEQ